MNREIKFRVWDGAGKYFEYFNLQEIPHGCATCVAPPQQFTGLKDKNGKEIYEGDIISYTPFNREDYKNTICKVPDFNKFHWFGELESMLEMPNQCDIEVIGNIFENPEFLK